MKRPGLVCAKIVSFALACCLVCAFAPAAYAVGEQGLVAGSVAAQSATEAPKPKKVKNVQLISRVVHEITVLWDEPKLAEGLTDQTYTVRYSYKKSMKGAKTKKSKYGGVDIGKMKTGKRVYVQVRANAKYGKKVVHSGWSKVKSVRVDKTHKYSYGLINENLLFGSVDELWDYCDKHNIAARASGYIKVVEAK